MSSFMFWFLLCLGKPLCECTTLNCQPCSSNIVKSIEHNQHETTTTSKTRLNYKLQSLKSVAMTAITIINPRWFSSVQQQSTKLPRHTRPAEPTLRLNLTGYVATPLPLHIVMLNAFLPVLHARQKSA